MVLMVDWVNRPNKIKMKAILKKETINFFPIVQPVSIPVLCLNIKWINVRHYRFFVFENASPKNQPVFSYQSTFLRFDPANNIEFGNTINTSAIEVINSL